MRFLRDDYPDVSLFKIDPWRNCETVEGCQHDLARAVTVAELVNVDGQHPTDTLSKIAGTYLIQPGTNL